MLTHVSHQIGAFSIVVLLLTSCNANSTTDNASSTTDIVRYAHTTSPNGDIRAYAYEFNNENGELTQVVLQFPRGCGSGSAAAYASNLNLELRWIDNENLEVRHPEGVIFQHNASGETLQCFDRKVRVILVPRKSRTQPSNKAMQPTG